MKRVLSIVTAALVVGSIAAVAGGTAVGASGPSSADRSSQGIVEGHYEGRDSQGNHIRFAVSVNHGLHISTFRINHVELGAIAVKDRSFTHDCNVKLYCAHGHWTYVDRVSGGWRYRHGQTVAYTAHWVERWSH